MVDEGDRAADLPVLERAEPPGLRGRIMAVTGQTLENPVSGERITFRTALVRVEVRPALKMEQLFETAVALAEQGRTMLGGVPKPLELALFTREFEQEVQAAFPPRTIQRLALAPLARLGKRRGRSLGLTRKAARRLQQIAPVVEGGRC